MGIMVKICGVNSAEAADAVVRAGADFAGLMFHPRSPRNLRLDAARALAERLQNRVKLVAVLTDADDATIAEVVGAVRPRYLQLHGRETPERVAAVRARFGVEIIKVIAIAEAADFATLPAQESVADMILLDAKAPNDATRPGGLGAAFDWQLLQGRKFSRPWMLAGGLNPGNVARAIASSGAPAVDVSSGVETAPGVKSAALIGEFVHNARSAHFAAETRA